MATIPSVPVSTPPVMPAAVGVLACAVTCLDSPVPRLKRTGALAPISIDLSMPLNPFLLRLLLVILYHTLATNPGALIFLTLLKNLNRSRLRLLAKVFVSDSVTGRGAATVAAAKVGVITGAALGDGNVCSLITRCLSLCLCVGCCICACLLICLGICLGSCLGILL